MARYRSIYVNTTGCNNWILKIIADDIVRELSALGYKVRKGLFEDYKGEDIAYHMWWRVAVPYKEASVNSVFITHTDDAMKEQDLHRMKGQFDSYITMSDEDAMFLRDLGYDKDKVIGLNLAVRNTYIKPVSLGIFSSCYTDNRKNENWLLEYCQKHDVAKLANFVFVGQGWGVFAEKLSSLGCSFEWHCVSRDLPHEYFFQQLKLSNLDFYLYMGMDGGAMGTYDAYAMGAALCVSDDGYHKAIPDIEYKFETKEQYFDALDNILLKHKRKLDFYAENSVSNYVKKLSQIWEGCYEGTNNHNTSESSFKTVVEKRRSNYFPNSFVRIKQTLSSYFWRKKSSFKYSSNH